MILLKKRYIKLRATLNLIAIFTVLYFFAYFLASVTYQLIYDIPADNSRSVSWIYYGVIFSTIPYFIIGLGYKLIILKNQNIHISAIHTITTTFITEKVSYVFLASLFAKGFPTSWYGSVFPHSGFALLSEELPFYSDKYVYYYIFFGTILGYLSFYIGGIINRYIEKTKKVSEQMK